MSGSLREPTVCNFVLFQAIRSQAITRFQRRQYAQIDIVLTEKKGFGLRASENLSRFALLSVFVVFLALTCVFSPLVQGYVYL